MGSTEQTEGNDMRLLRTTAWIAAACFAVVIVFLLSYAPYLRSTDESDSPYYRAPAVYRPAEWAMLHTPLRGPLMGWAELWGVHGRTEWQIWYYAQGVNEPANGFHFSL